MHDGLSLWLLHARSPLPLRADLGPRPRGVSVLSAILLPEGESHKNHLQFLTVGEERNHFEINMPRALIPLIEA